MQLGAYSRCSSGPREAARLLHSFTTKISPNRLTKLEARTKSLEFKFQATQMPLKSSLRCKRLDIKLFAWEEHASFEAMKKMKIALQLFIFNKLRPPSCPAEE